MKELHAHALVPIFEFTMQVEEEELYFFTSSLLGMLAEYDVRPPQINASTITIGAKVILFVAMFWGILVALYYTLSSIFHLCNDNSFM
jgi:hypothetical protein